MIRIQSKKGFSLVELMVTFVIVSVVIAGVVGGYYSFIDISRETIKQTSVDANVKMALKLIQRDLNMAGYGLPPNRTRVASNDGSGMLDEPTDGVDYNCDGDTLDLINIDRIFIADGWQILTDVTDNGEEDGNIMTSPTDYFSIIANVRENGGYFTSLTVPVTAGDSDLTVASVNINSGDEYQAPDNDFTNNTAVNIYGPDGGGTIHLEGRRITTITSPGGIITLKTGETFVNGFTTADSVVVPGIAWYVEIKAGDNVPWLYRNENKIISYLVDLQFEYGYVID